MVRAFEPPELLVAVPLKTISCQRVGKPVERGSGVKMRNEARIKEPHIEDMRSAIEHRATWFYLLLHEARKKGLAWDDFARRAVFRTGYLHGKGKFTRTADLRQFAKEFSNELERKIFEQNIIEATEDRFIVEFGYCPLVAAWMKLTDNGKDIAHLCDIAMEGDRGIISRFPGFQLDLQKTIASGDEVCRLVITKKNAPVAR